MNDVITQTATEASNVNAKPMCIYSCISSYDIKVEQQQCSQIKNCYNLSNSSEFPEEEEKEGECINSTYRSSLEAGETKIIKLLGRGS